MAHAMTREVEKKAEDAADHLGGTASKIMQSAQQTAGEWTEKAKENLGSLTDAASGYVEQGRETLGTLGRSIGDTVQNRPLSTLLLAVGVGFLAGVIVVRR